MEQDGRGPEAFDQVIFTLIERAEADPGLGERTDVLALLLRSRPADETGMSRQDICDELVTLIGAGHETTTSALSRAFERLRRHPDVLAELVREVDEGGSDFRRATILEVLRVRPIIDLPGRRVSAPHFDLGAWRIPHNHNVFVSLADLHESGFGVYRINFEDNSATYCTLVMKARVAGFGSLMEGPDGRGLVFQMTLPPKDFEAMSSPAIREHLRRVSARRRRHSTTAP